MKKLYIFFVLFLSQSYLFSQNISDVLAKQIGMNSPTIYREAQINLKLGDVDKALVCYSQAVKQAQKQRNSGNGVNAELLAEYAYTLALNHDFEAAMINIDRARMLGMKYGDFYSAQILLLMGHNNAAELLMKQAKIPNWINGVYQGLNEKYKVVASITPDAPEIVLKRANKLAADKQVIQAITLFEELVTIYPDVSIFYIDYSTVWESLGYYGYAAQLLQKGLDRMPQDSINVDSRQVFVNHLNSVNKMNAEFENVPWLKRMLGMEPPKLMTYLGASFAKDVYSLNGRMGVYTSNKFSASLNLGFNYSGEQFSGTIGLSAYKAWGILVAGLGLSEQFSENSDMFSLAPSIGLTFLNKAQTSSFDIMLNGYVPFSSNQKFSYSISIGKTVYFDLNGLLK